MHSNSYWLLALCCTVISYFSGLRHAKREEAERTLRQVEVLIALAKSERKYNLLNIFDRCYESLEHNAERKIFLRQRSFGPALLAFYTISFGYLLVQTSPDVVFLLAIAVWFAGASGMKSGRDEWKALTPDLLAHSFSEQTIRSITEIDLSEVSIQDLCQRLRYFEHLILFRNGPPPGMKNPDRYMKGYSDLSQMNKDMLV